MHLLVILLLCIPAWNADAEPVAVTAPDELKFSPSLELSYRILTSVNDYSNDAALRVSEMTLGLIDMKFDVHEKKAHLKLGGGDPEEFRLCMNSKIILGEGKARVRSQLDLAVVGYRMLVEIPDLDLDSESVSGQRAYTLSVPLLKQHF